MNCVVAQDSADKYYYNGSATASGWIELTQYSGTDYAYSWQNLVHQDPSDSAILTLANSEDP